VEPPATPAATGPLSYPNPKISTKPAAPPPPATASDQRESSRLGRGIAQFCDWHFPELDIGRDLCQDSAEFLFDGGDAENGGAADLAAERSRERYIADFDPVGIAVNAVEGIVSSGGQVGRSVASESRLRLVFGIVDLGAVGVRFESDRSGHQRLQKSAYSLRQIIRYVRASTGLWPDSADR